SRCTPDVRCGGDLQCLCGVCTGPCGDSASCGELGSDAVCQFTQERSLANDCESGALPRLCTRPGTGTGAGGSSTADSSSGASSTSASSTGGSSGVSSTDATSSGGTSSTTLTTTTTGSGGSTSSTSGASGSAGMGGACVEDLPGAFPECECYEDGDCPADRVCYGQDCALAFPGVCAVPPTEGCYGDRDCSEDESCVGGVLAPCGSLGPNAIGTCEPAICPCEPGACGENEQMCLSGDDECILAQGPLNDGICRGGDGTCFYCECTAAD